MGNLQGLGERRRPLALHGGLVSKLGDLLRPRLDLELPLHEQLIELETPALHLPEAAVDDLDLLTPFGELEAGLRQRFPLQIAIRADLGDAGLEPANLLTARVRRSLGLGQAGLRLLPTGMRLIACLLEGGKLGLHPGKLSAHIVGVAPRPALFRLHGGQSLSGGQHIGAALLHHLLRLGQPGGKRIDRRLVVVVGLLIVGEEARGLTQIDLTLDNALGGTAASMVAAEHEPAPVDQITLARRDGEERERGIGLPELEERAEIVRDVGLTQHAERRMPRIDVAERGDRRHQPGRQFMETLGAEPHLGDAQHGGTDLLRLQLGQDAQRGAELGHADRLGGGTKDGLDRLAEVRLHRKPVGDGQDLRARERGVQSSLQHGLRALPESFPLFLQLLQEPQPRGALGQLAIDLLQPTLGIAEFAGEIGDRLLRHGTLVVGAGAGGEGLLDAGDRLGGKLLRRLALRADARQLLGEQVVLVDAGLLVDLVPGAVGAQPRDRAFHLQQLELGLIKLLLQPRELTLGDSQLPVALLVGGVAAAEQFQLLLLVLRSRVGLRRNLAQLHFQLVDAATGGSQAVLKAGPFDLSEIGPVLRGLALRAHVEHRLLRILHALPKTAPQSAPFGQRVLLGVEPRAALVSRGAQSGHPALEVGEGRGQFGVLTPAPREREVPQPVAEALVTHRLGGLPAEAADLAGNLPDHVGHAGKILIRQRQLLQRLAPLRLVLGNTGRLFEHRTALLRFRRQDLVDLALRHDRVARPAHAGVHEELLDVLQPARLAVEGVLALAVAVHAAGDLDLVELAAELLLALGEQQGDLADLRRLAGVGPLENDVLHLAAAQGLRALFTQHPADGVGDVRLTATIGADDGGHAGFKLEGGGIREAFEPVQLERLEIHAVGRSRD